MTGLEGNRQIYLPLEIQDPESQGANRYPITPGTSHYLFYYTIMLLKEKNNYFYWKLISYTMGLIRKKTHMFE